MRSNGLRPALALLLLATAPAWAQDAASGSPPPDEAAAAPASAVATDVADAGQASPTEDPDSDPGSVASDVPAQGTPVAPEPEPETAAGDRAAPVADAQQEPTGTSPSDAPTEAESDFADIYGTPGPASGAALPGAYDPWEGYNRRMHRFNNAVDQHVARPLARGYVKAVPRPMRTGVSNFFNNLGQPLTVVNSLLQGKGRQAGQAFGRFLLNTTFGIGGIFDPASRANLPQKNEDFGQTLGVWGWRRSRYFELPFFGPRTVRDVFGMAGDAPLSPLRNVEADRFRVPLQGLQLVDVRARLLSTDSLREGAEDDYALVRDAWSQRRDYQIFGDRMDGEELPDYLREDESDTIVPVDAMPVTVPVGG